jgi:hypothetical protein
MSLVGTKGLPKAGWVREDELPPEVMAKLRKWRDVAERDRQSAFMIDNEPAMPSLEGPMYWGRFFARLGAIEMKAKLGDVGIVWAAVAGLLTKARLSIGCLFSSLGYGIMPDPFRLAIAIDRLRSVNASMHQRLILIESAFVGAKMGVPTILVVVEKGVMVPSYMPEAPHLVALTREAQMEMGVERLYEGRLDKDMLDKLREIEAQAQDDAPIQTPWGPVSGRA